MAIAYAQTEQSTIVKILGDLGVKAKKVGKGRNHEVHISGSRCYRFWIGKDSEDSLDSEVKFLNWLAPGPPLPYQGKSYTVIPLPGRGMLLITL